MEIKFKPCPFCGGKRIEYILKWYSERHYLGGCECMSCGAECYLLDVAFGDRSKFTDEERKKAYDQIKSKWNKRAEPERPVVMRAERKGHWINKNGLYECSECGVWFPNWSAYCRDCGAKNDEE